MTREKDTHFLPFWKRWVCAHRPATQWLNDWDCVPWLTWLLTDMLNSYCSSHVTNSSDFLRRVCGVQKPMSFSCCFFALEMSSMAVSRCENSELKRNCFDLTVDNRTTFFYIHPKHTKNCVSVTEQRSQAFFRFLAYQADYKSLGLLQWQNCLAWFTY